MELKVYHNQYLSSWATKVEAVFDKYNKKNLVPLKFFPDHDITKGYIDAFILLFVNYFPSDSASSLQS